MYRSRSAAQGGAARSAALASRVPGVHSSPGLADVSSREVDAPGADDVAASVVGVAATPGTPYAEEVGLPGAGLGSTEGR